LGLTISEILSKLTRNVARTKEAPDMKMGLVIKTSARNLSVAVYSYPGTDPSSRDQCLGAVR